jgi:molybdopterin converting factor small subunit
VGYSTNIKGEPQQLTFLFLEKEHLCYNLAGYCNGRLSRENRMPKLKFTRHLVRYFPTLTDNISITGATVSQLIENINTQFPGLADYIVDEKGQLRKHVNIFIAGELIHDRQTLSDPVNENDTVYIFQALSGG